MDIGIDVLDIARMERLADKETFYKKYFTDNEAAYIKASANVPQMLAGYYSCKEAFLKAVGIGIGRGIDLKDIEIGYTALGRPEIRLTDKATEVFNNHGYSKISISITDSQSVSVAACIVY